MNIACGIRTLGVADSMADEDLKNMRSAWHATMLQNRKPVARQPHLSGFLFLSVGLWLIIIASCYMLIKLAGG